MYYVYVIQSKKNKHLYFGRTKDLDSRIKKHNSGTVHSTRTGVPWMYVYIEGYRAKEDAVKRELILKQYGNARTYIKKRIKESIES